MPLAHRLVRRRRLVDRRERAHGLAPLLRLRAARRWSTFRVYWGFFGSSTARFSQFVRGPRAIVSYLKGRWAAMPGHNPLGALSVLALLGLAAHADRARVVRGGRRRHRVRATVDLRELRTGRVAGGVARKLFDALLWFIGLHVAAVLFYLFYQEGEPGGSDAAWDAQVFRRASDIGKNRFLVALHRGRFARGGC